MTLQTAIQPDDDFLLDDGLPCLRRDGKLYYLGDMQPRVLEACRRVEITFEQLAEKLGTNRATLVLVLKGYDPVSLPLKSMIDRLVEQTGLQPTPMSYCDLGTQTASAQSSGESPSDSQPDSPSNPVPPVSTTIHAVPIPQDENAPASGSDRPPVTVPVEEVVIPDVVSLDRPGAPHVVVPPSPPDLSGFTPGLRRTPRRGSAAQQRQFLLT